MSTLTELVCHSSASNNYYVGAALLMLLVIEVVVGKLMTHGEASVLKLMILDKDVVSGTAFYISLAITSLFPCMVQHNNKTNTPTTSTPASKAASKAD